MGGGLGVEARGRVLGMQTAGPAQRVLLVGQTLGGGLRGKACLWIWLHCKGGPAFWRRERENWNTFSKLTETGYAEGMGRGECRRADEGRNRGGKGTSSVPTKQPFPTAFQPALEGVFV